MTKYTFQHFTKWDTHSDLTLIVQIAQMLCTSLRQNQNLSLLNTIKMLYKYDRKTLSNIIKNKNGSDNQVNQAIAYTKKFPNKAGGWGNLGDAYKAKKDYPKAIQSYKKAITLDTQNAELHSLLGQIYDLSGNKNGAFFEYKKACDLKKSDISYLYKFAQLCRENNRNAIGINYINNYLKQHPEEKNDTRLMQIKSSL